MSHSNHKIDADDTDSDSMGWRSLPDMVQTLDNNYSSDTDGAE